MVLTKCRMMGKMCSRKGKTRTKTQTKKKENTGQNLNIFFEGVDGINKM